MIWRGVVVLDGRPSFSRRRLVLIAIVLVTVAIACCYSNYEVPVCRTIEYKINI